MTQRDQIDAIYNKLNEMSEFLGQDSKKARRGATEFENLKNDFLERRHEVEQCLDQKEDPATPQSDIGRITFQIRQGIIKMEDLQTGMESDISRRKTKKKTAPEILEKQGRILQNCRLLLEDVKARNSGYAARTHHKVQTLTDMKAKLLREIEATDNQIQQIQEQQVEIEMDEEQVEAINEFQKGDQIIDDRMDGIIDGIDRIKQHARNINKGVDQVKQQVQKNKKAVAKTSDKIKTQNEKLKQIIKKFKPNNCCLWLAMFLALGGLIVVIVNMATKK